MIVAIIATILFVIGIIWLMAYAIAKDIVEDRALKSVMPKETSNPVLEFEEKWKEHYRKENEAQIRYNNRPAFPKEEKEQVKLMYAYCAETLDATEDSLINWINQTFKNTPTDRELRYTYRKWRYKGVLPPDDINKSFTEYILL
jgi:hypothetical protein